MKITLKTILFWIFFALLVGGSLYCIYQVIDSFGPEYTEPEIIPDAQQTESNWNCYDIVIGSQKDSIKYYINVDWRNHIARVISNGPTGIDTSYTDPKFTCPASIDLLKEIKN